jgi:hypothetical protein
MCENSIVRLEDSADEPGVVDHEFVSTKPNGERRSGFSFLTNVLNNGYVPRRVS